MYSQEGRRGAHKTSDTFEKKVANGDDKNGRLLLLGDNTYGVPRTCLFGKVGGGGHKHVTDNDGGSAHRWPACWPSVSPSRAEHCYQTAMAQKKSDQKQTIEWTASSCISNASNAIVARREPVQNKVMFCGKKDKKVKWW